jgi:hypothetical protein
MMYDECKNRISSEVITQHMSLRENMDEKEQVKELNVE